MENKTAVQILVDDLKSVGIKFKSEMYLAIEKKQIIDSYTAGFYAGCDQPLLDTMPKSYYEETYSPTPINKEA